MKKSLSHQNFPFPSLERRFPPYPSNAICKTVAGFTYQSRGVEIIFTHFSVWLRTMTQFNISKNEMSLKMLLFIGNGFLISTWKYWKLISKNESILRTNKFKRMDLRTPSLPNNFENLPTMGWNDVTLKCMLQAVYQLWNINFGKHQKNLFLLFSDLQCYAITIFVLI